MVNLITNVGGEWLYENNTNNVTVDVGLYDHSTDSLDASDNLSAITTEPTGGSYNRQSTNVTTRNEDGTYGIDNDDLLTFDATECSQTVDSAFFVVNFQSDTVAGDGGSTDNLVAVADLTQTRDLFSIDLLEIPAGDLTIEGV